MATQEEIDMEELISFFRRNEESVRIVRPFVPFEAIINVQSLGRRHDTVSTRRNEVESPPAQTLFLPITIDYLDPSHGPSQAMDTDIFIAIHGSGFHPGTTVQFGNLDMQVFNVNFDGTIITVYLAAHAPGDVTVGVTNPDGQTASLYAGFHFDNPPFIQYVFPNAGKLAGGTVVTLRGDHFDPDIIVTFGHNQAFSVFVEPDGTKLTCVSPAGDALGFVNVLVTNPDNQTNTFENGFQYTTDGGGGTVYMFVNPQDISNGALTEITIHACRSFDYNNVETLYNESPTMSVLSSTGLAALGLVPAAGEPVPFTNGVAIIEVQAVLSNFSIPGNFQLGFTSTGGWVVSNFATTIGVF